MTTAAIWTNKRKTSERSCACGSWQAHWINRTGRSWPLTCSVERCACLPTLGAHIISPSVKGERIAPLCNGCNQSKHSFTLKLETPLADTVSSLRCGFSRS